MADSYIKIVLNDERQKKLHDLGLASQIKEDGGKKFVLVTVNDKEQKKLIKAFPDLKFDASSTCVLPEEAETKLFNIIGDLKTLDVMKVAISKLYNPLAGKAPRSAQR